MQPVFRVVCSPASIPEFRNSGFSNRATHVLAAHCHCTHLSCTGPLRCPWRALNLVPSNASRSGATSTAATIQSSVHWAWCQRHLRRNLLHLLHLVDVITILRRPCRWLRRSKRCHRSSLPSSLPSSLSSSLLRSPLLVLPLLLRPCCIVLV